MINRVNYDALRFLFGFSFVVFISVMKPFDFSIMDLPKSAAPLWLFKILLTLLSLSFVTFYFWSESDVLLPENGPISQLRRT